jgi:hypothetical protein
MANAPVFLAIRWTVFIHVILKGDERQING